jgi:CHAT domain-containing protein
MGAVAQDVRRAPALDRVTHLIASGRNMDAIEAATRSAETAAPGDRQAAYQLAAQVCIVTLDVDCAVGVVNSAVPFLQTIPVAEQHPATALYCMLLLSFHQVMTGDYRSSAEWLGPKFPSHLSSISDPVLFADAHLLAARRARLVGDFEASRDHLDKALAAALSLESEQFEAARLIVRIAFQLLANYDSERALRLVIAAEPLLQAIPPESSLAYEFLALRATLAGYRMDLDSLSADLSLALSRLDRLQVPAARRATLKSSAYNDLLGAELLRGNHAAARTLLQSHPLTAAKPAILQRGTFADAGEFGFAVAEELIGWILNDPIETRWDDLFQRPPRWTTDPEQIEGVEAFGQAVIGLHLLRAGRPEEARRELVQAGRRRLATLQALYRKSTYSSPLADWLDQLLLEIAVGATLATEAPDLELLLGTQIVLNRSIETGPDDALTIQAAQPSDDRKRIARSLQTIEYQRRAWEKARVATLVRRLLVQNRRSSDAVAKDRHQLLSNANDFATHLQRLRGALPGKADSVTLGGLQQVLLPDEAVIFHVPALANVGKICIRADRALAAQETRDRTIDADARLLRAALTATHAASIDGDSQFPAAEAVRLNKFLFGGLEDCLRASHRIYWLAPPGPLAQVPPAALLPELPPRLGSGFDLRAARWLVRDHSFVRTRSIDALVAAKRLSRSKGASLDYLGVGDPVLDPARGGGPNSLPELPQTSDELEQVAKLFESTKARLLRRDGASEEAFRLQPLSEFDLIHFATHGLIREELPGLPEPSLVLTPGVQGDAFNDGLLSASQIAALPLRARLVVLSACNSARYEPSLIDSGIQGLSASFAIAGVPAMIASQWPIESSLTRDLIAATFRAARGPQSMAIADALAVAVRRHLEEPAPRPLMHPRFWAALVVLGDGSLKLGATNRSDERDLGPYAAMAPTTQEEILSAAPLDGDLVTSTIGPWNGKRSPSLIRRLTPDDRMQWVLSDPAIGAGLTAVASPVIYAAGYVSADSSAVSAPVLRRLAPDGTLLWSHGLPAGPASTMVMGLAVEADRSALALAGPVHGTTTGAEFSLIRVDGTGSEVARLPIALRGDARARHSGHLAVDEARALVAINRGVLPRDQPDGFNGLGLPEFCVAGDVAEIVLVDLHRFHEVKRLRIDRFKANGALRVSDGWILVGEARGGCSGETSAAAYAVGDDGSVKEFWRDRSPFETWAQGVRRTASGIEVIGYTRRSVAIREEAAMPAHPDFSSMRWGEEAYVSGEVFSVRLTEAGREQRRDFVGAGFPVLPNGMVSTAEHSVIYGTVGSRPLWMVR